MRIYIAEDDPSVIGVLEDILESSALGRVCGASEEGAPDPERIMALDPDLVLVDLGASWEYYCADVSRTFPANGKFTPRQKLLYEIVLAGLTAALDAA